MALFNLQADKAVSAMATAVEVVGKEYQNSTVCDKERRNSEILYEEMYMLLKQQYDKQS